jgi:hypothetical protein
MPEPDPAVPPEPPSPVRPWSFAGGAAAREVGGSEPAEGELVAATVAGPRSPPPSPGGNATQPSTSSTNTAAAAYARRRQ